MNYASPPKRTRSSFRGTRNLSLTNQPTLNHTGDMTVNIFHFMDRYEEIDGCWVWQGPLNAQGQGRFASIPAHRWIWIHHNGPIGKGRIIFQMCRNHACVKPEHLREMTRAQVLEHTSRKPGLLRTGVCKNGHKVERGTIREDNRGFYECVTCRRERSARYRATHQQGRQE